MSNQGASGNADSLVVTLLSALLVGASWTGVFLTATVTLQAGTVVLAAGVATVLVSVTHGLAVVGAGEGSLAALVGDIRSLCARLPTILAGWLGAVAVRSVVAVFVLVGVGGTLGTIDAAVRYLQYSAGAPPPTQPASTMGTALLLGGAVLSAVAISALPVQFVLPLLVDGRGPRAAIVESAGLLRREPRAAVRHWALRTVLAAIPLSLFVLVVRTGAVGYEYELTRRLTRVVRTPQFSGLEGLDVLYYGALALGVATAVAAARTRLAVSTLDRLDWRGTAGPPVGRLGRLLAPRTIVLVAVVLLLVSSAGAVVRMTDQTPTPDVTQSVADVEDPGRMLDIAVRNRNRTSYEHRNRMRIASDSRQQRLNDSEVLERDSSLFDTYGVFVFDRETREAAIYSETRNTGDSPFTLGYYVTDVGWYGTGIPVRGHTAEPVYQPETGPSRANMDALWAREAAWNTTMYGGEAEMNTLSASPMIDPLPADEANLTVQSRNESHVVLVVPGDRAARNYYRVNRSRGAFLAEYRGFVTDDPQPAITAVRNDADLEEAIALHDASVRIVIETDTGRVEHTGYTANLTSVDRIGENESRLDISRRRVSITTHYRNYDDVTVERPAGVPGPFGRPTANSLLGRLLDYLRY